MSDYREMPFLRLQDDFLAARCTAGIANVQCVPISALEGDNVRPTACKRMPCISVLTRCWSTSDSPAFRKTIPANFPLPGAERWIRPDGTFSSAASPARIASGVSHSSYSSRRSPSVGALPSGRKRAVRSVVTYDGRTSQAASPIFRSLQLDEEIDLSRATSGCLQATGLPNVSRKLHASVVWLQRRAPQCGRTYLVKHKHNRSPYKSGRSQSGQSRQTSTLSRKSPHSIGA